MKDKLMTSDDFKYLPLGLDGFHALRSNKMIYVDKTALIYELANITNGYFFLSRPRRFGKTLLISTFESLFKNGLQDFKGLAIEKLWDDKTYPVVHLNFSGCKANDVDEFKRVYTEMVENAFTRAGLPLEPINERCQTISGRVENLVLGLDNLQIVLLIDEYDAPLNYCLRNPELFEQIRHELIFFYSMLKRISGRLRFFFFTGICKHLCLFSDINYVTDISLDSKYGTLLGFTDDEIREYFTPFVENLALVSNISVEECFAKLKARYTGYCFDRQASTQVYTPWSVLSLLAFPRDDFFSYWFSSGGNASTLLNYIAGPTLRDPCYYAKDIRVPISELNTPGEHNRYSDYVLLNQTGYLTIKRVSPLGTTAILNYPNIELALSMARLYSNKLFKGNNPVAKIRMDAQKLFATEDIPVIAEKLNMVLTDLSYESYPITNESTLRHALLIYLIAGSVDAFSELNKAYESSNLEFEAGNRYFVLELKTIDDRKYKKKQPKKIQSLLDEAVTQIKEKHYGESCSQGKELVRMAMVFSISDKCFVLHSVV